MFPSLPWTRIVRDYRTEYKGKKIDLLPFLRSNKDNFVLKPNSEYGGKGVVVGVDVSQEAWEKSIKNAQKSPYVTQEYVKIPVMEFPVFEPDL